MASLKVTFIRKSGDPGKKQFEKLISNTTLKSPEVQREESGSVDAANEDAGRSRAC